MAAGRYPVDTGQELRRQPADRTRTGDGRRGGDRKSTRLNSSHPSISYAVFCLKKKKSNPPPPPTTHRLRPPERRPPEAPLWAGPTPQCPAQSRSPRPPAIPPPAPSLQPCSSSV